MPADGYWSNHWMKHPVGFGTVNPRPTADIVLLTLFFKSDAAWNESGWKNEKFDQLLVAARGETDEAKRTQMYADMQVMIHEHCGIGIPIFTPALDAHVKKLKGLSADPARRPDGLQLRRTRLARSLTPDRRPGIALAIDRLAASLTGLGSLLAVSVVVFAITTMLPGDVAEEMLGQNATPEAVAALRTAMGLDAARARALLRLAGRHGHRRSRHVARQPAAGRRS